MSSRNKPKRSRVRDGEVNQPRTEGNGKSKEEKKETEINPTPLKGKVFFLHLHQYSAASKLERDLIELGGVVEKFFCKDVTHVITNRKNISNVDSIAASTPSPAMSNPSPGTVNFKSSKGALDSPQNLDSPNSTDGKCKNVSAIARGKAMAQKAAFKQGIGTTDVLTTAKNWGAKIKELDKVLDYIAAYKKKLGPEDNTKKSKATKNEPKPQSSRKGRNIKTPFLKVEDRSRHYKPLVKELSQWPTVGLDTEVGCCPYDGVAYEEGHGAERSEDRGHKSQETRKDVPSTSRASARESRLLTAGEARREAEERKKRRKNKGYCECCHVQYENLEVHLKSDTHHSFVNKTKQYASLDAMVTEGPNMERFLEDVLKFHAETQEQIDRMQEFNDDQVVLLSSPLTETSKRKKDEAKPGDGEPQSLSRKCTKGKGREKPNVGKQTPKVSGQSRCTDEQLLAGKKSLPKDCFVFDEPQEETKKGKQVGESNKKTDTKDRCLLKGMEVSIQSDRTVCVSKKAENDVKGKKGQRQCVESQQNDEENAKSGSKINKTDSNLVKQSAIEGQSSTDKAKKRKDGGDTPVCLSPEKKAKVSHHSGTPKQTVVKKGSKAKTTPSPSGDAAKQGVTKVRNQRKINQIIRKTSDVKRTETTVKGTNEKAISKATETWPNMNQEKSNIEKQSLVQAKGKIETGAISQTIGSLPDKRYKEKSAIMPSIEKQTVASPEERKVKDAKKAKPEQNIPSPSIVKSPKAEMPMSISRIFSSEFSIEEFAGFTNSDIEQTRQHLEELKAIKSSLEVVVFPSEPDPIDVDDNDDVFLTNDGNTVNFEVVSQGTDVSDWENCLSGFLERQTSSNSLKRLTSMDEDSTKENRSKNNVQCMQETKKQVKVVQPSKQKAVPKERPKESEKTLQRLNSSQSTVKLDLDPTVHTVFQRFSESDTRTSFGMSTSFYSNIRESRQRLMERQKQKEIELKRAKELQKEKELEHQRRKLMKERRHSHNPTSKTVISPDAAQSTSLFSQGPQNPCDSTKIGQLSRTFSGPARINVNNNYNMQTTGNKTQTVEICNVNKNKPTLAGNSKTSADTDRRSKALEMNKRLSNQSKEVHFEECFIVRQHPETSDEESVRRACKSLPKSPVFKRGIKNKKQLPSNSPTFKKGVKNAREFAEIRETPKRKVKRLGESHVWKSAEVFASPHRKRRGKRVSPRKSARKSLMNENYPGGIIDSSEEILALTEEERIILEELVLDETDSEIDFPVVENSSPLKSEVIMASSPIKTVQGLRNSPAKASPLRIRSDSNSQHNRCSAVRRILTDSPEKQNCSQHTGPDLVWSAPTGKSRNLFSPSLKGSFSPVRPFSASPSTPSRRQCPHSPRTPKNSRWTKKLKGGPGSPSSLERSPTYQYGSGHRLHVKRKPHYSMEILYPSLFRDGHSRRRTRSLLRRISSPTGNINAVRRSLAKRMKGCETFSFKDSDSVLSIHLQ